ncbi:MAG: hypothetical protein H0W07_02660, partial [Chloroflexi bacterium]|nr:hypothetical protein [Chloroflexota bacterium]
MTPELIVIVIVLGTTAAVGVIASINRQRALDRVREALRAAPGADLGPAIRDTMEKVADAEVRAERRANDLAQLADLLGVGVVRVDDRMIVRLANRAAHVFLGRRSGGLIDLSAMEAFVDARIESLVRTAREVGAASGELTLREARERIVAVRARRSQVDGIWVVMEDVTELRRLQRIRAEFIDNLSHELRTPLTTVRLLTETVLRDVETMDVSPRLRDMVQKIDVETGHLAQMVSELL